MYVCMFPIAMTACVTFFNTNIEIIEVNRRIVDVK